MYEQLTHHTSSDQETEPSVSLGVRHVLIAALKSSALHSLSNENTSPLKHFPPIITMAEKP